MGQIILGEPLASQIKREAEAQGVDVEIFVEAALKYYRFQMQKEKMSAEAEWWRSQPEAVHKRYAGEFVAVHQHEVIDHDRDEEERNKSCKRWSNSYCCCPAF